METGYESSEQQKDRITAESTTGTIGRQNWKESAVHGEKDSEKKQRRRKTMKKLICNHRIILTAVLVLALLLTACSASPDSTKDNQGDTTVASETPVATTTEQKDTESLSTEQVNTTEAATTAQANAKKDDSEVLPEEPLKKPDNLVFGETEHKTTPMPEGNWSAEVPDFGAFYQVLTEKQDDLWKAYQDGDAEFYRYAADPESSDQSAAPLMLPELPGVGFFKGDGSETPEKAAETLIGMMLSCINEIPENDRWFTLTGYEIRDVKCYDGETVGEIAELLELGTFDSESKTYINGLSGIRLPENVWLFDPRYTCTYTGKVMFGEEALHPEQTVFTYDNAVSKQGVPLGWYYVLIRQGNLWRCEGSVMIPRCYVLID